jgi:hypothetical protein
MREVLGGETGRLEVGIARAFAKHKKLAPQRRNGDA